MTPPKLSSHGSATALMVNGQSPGNKIQCVYCSGNHFSASCTKNPNLEILKQDRRCFVCLKSGHRSNQCSNQRGCRWCTGRHHQSICNQRVSPIKPDAQEPAAPAKVKVLMVPIQTNQFKIKSKVRNLVHTLFMYRAPLPQPVPIRRDMLRYKLQLP